MIPIFHDKIYSTSLTTPYHFFKLVLTPCKIEQSVQGMALQQKEEQKDYNIQKIC